MLRVFRQGPSKLNKIPMNVLKNLLAGTVVTGLAIGSASAVSIFQIDFELSGSPAGQSTEAGWTSWTVDAGGNGTDTIANTVGGVGVSLVATGGGIFNARGGSGQNRSTTIAGTSWNDMAEDLISARSGDNGVKITLSGLITGQTYTLTGWHNDSTPGTNAGFAADLDSNTPGYVVNVLAGTGATQLSAANGASTSVDQTATRSDSDFSNSVVTFTADATTVEIDYSASTTVTFNPVAFSGLELSSPVPEPSSALLLFGGLTGLMLRRRR